MSISLVKPTPQPIPVGSPGATGQSSMSSLPPVPANMQAQGQVAGSSSITAPPPGGGLTTPIISGSTSAWMTTTSATSSIYTSGGTGVVYVNAVVPPRKPRRPREKRHVPLYTAGLEAKLNKALDKDPTRVIRYIARKVEQHPRITNGANEDIYEFDTTMTFSTSSGFSASASVLQTPIIQTHTVKFYARLVLRPDGTLCEYEVRMGGQKR